MEKVFQLPPARLFLILSLVSDPFLYTSMANQAAGSQGWYMVLPDLTRNRRKPQRGQPPTPTLIQHLTRLNETVYTARAASQTCP